MAVPKKKKSLSLKKFNLKKKLFFFKNKIKINVFRIKKKFYKIEVSKAIYDFKFN